MLDDPMRQIINRLQGGFPIGEYPFEAVGERLGMDPREVIDRIENLLRERKISRFGPMYNAEKMGGAFCLCAMDVPEGCFDEVAAQVNAHPEVAHNYERDHWLNMWFVLATERPEQIALIAARIEEESGLKVYSMPKLEEFFVGLKVTV